MTGKNRSPSGVLSATKTACQAVYLPCSLPAMHCRRITVTANRTPLNLLDRADISGWRIPLLYAGDEILNGRNGLYCLRRLEKGA